MKVVYMPTLEAEQAFAKAAAEYFAGNPNIHLYSEGDAEGEIKPGDLLAWRWGVADQAVLVVRLSDFHTPTIYGDLVSQARNKLRTEQESKK